ncbi:hypothetical protein N7541_011193 [Penicillium brevicompactum]|uniref:Allergen Asp f 7 n=1 Tax=Penicillium brevicompactum TaxID=5074 RepID=A0A9W9QS89_PENBR|nr:hypothetical protein N7541_011193 [Penicillium brevicompactum]
MAPITKTLALAGAFFAMTGYSAPVAKRAVVWETVTDVVWTTIDVTTTLYPNQAPTATIVPVAAPAVPTTTTTAAAVVTPSETPSETPEETPEQKKVAPTSTSTTEAAPAPTVQVETSSAAPAPAPTEESSAAPAPVATTSTSTTPAVAANTRSADTESTASTGYTGACSEGSPCDGMITFYDTATTSTNPSSCGTTNDGASENVLALPVGIMKDGDCGKTVTITYNGQTATGTVVDKCMGCDDTSIDLSRHLFGQLASMDAGRVSGAKWYIH